MPLSRGELGPRLTQCGLDRGLLTYQVASSSIQPFGHNRHGLKIGAASPPFGEVELGPHLTQRGQGRGLYLHAKLHLVPSNRLATVTVYTNVTDESDRTDRTMVR